MKQVTFPGRELRRRREALGWTTEDVYRRYRIPVEDLERLESGAFDQLPARTYTAGFLRTYCRCLRLDPAPFMNALEQAYQQMPHKGLVFRSRTLFERNPWLVELKTWATVCVVLLLGWMAYSVVVRPHKPRGEGQVQAETIEHRQSDRSLHTGD